MGFFKGLIRVVEFDPLLTVEERKQQAAEEAAEATAEAAARAAGNADGDGHGCIIWLV